ncbi:MAG TPA: alpha/beta fold hydrolase [Vicinamibacteria bacterium]|nr:alpha/beta fold hydrolase [Vicinamibacteria bacterium]
MTTRRLSGGPRVPALLRRANAFASRVAPGAAAMVAERLFFTPAPAARGLDADVVRSGRASDLVVDGHAVRAYAWGRGPMVALVHGWSGTAGQVARALMPALVERGYGVVAFDAPGHGRSGGRMSSLPQFGRALRAVDREFGPLAAVVGHSLGTAAIALAVDEGLSAERVVMIAPAADPGAWGPAFAEAAGFTRSVMERVYRRAERRLAIRWSDFSPMTPMVSRIEAPLLVVHDRDDRETPWEDGEAVAAAAPRGTLVLTQGLGHRRILRDRDLAETIADFAAGGSVRERAGPPCALHDCPGTATDYGLCDRCALEADLFDRSRRGFSLSP